MSRSTPSPQVGRLAFQYEGAFQVAPGGDATARRESQDDPSLATTDSMSPSAPLAIAAAIQRWTKRKRRWWVTERQAPEAAAASTSRRASAEFVARGFSTRTWTPASSSGRARGAWSLGGAATTAASISPMTADASGAARGVFQRRANSRARSRSGSMSTEGRHPSRARDGRYP